MKIAVLIASIIGSLLLMVYTILMAKKKGCPPCSLSDTAYIVKSPNVFTFVTCHGVFPYDTADDCKYKWLGRLFGHCVPFWNDDGWSKPTLSDYWQSTSYDRCFHGSNFLTTLNWSYRLSFSCLLGDIRHYLPCQTKTKCSMGGRRVFYYYYNI